jgi:hypothetical protein
MIAPIIIIITGIIRRANVRSASRALLLISDYIMIINTLSTEDMLADIEYLRKDKNISLTELTLQSYTVLSEITPQVRLC